MKIGVLSDTHSKKLPAQMIQDLKGVDCIIHAGDLCDSSVLERLSQIKETYAVCGNMDNAEICQRLPKKKIIIRDNLKIGIFHGYGPPSSMLKKVQAAFASEGVDVVVFGHTHQTFNERIDNVLYFNPGSPTDEIFAPFRSYGILESSEQGVHGKIIEVKNDG